MQGLNALEKIPYQIKTTNKAKKVNFWIIARVWGNKLLDFNNRLIIKIILYLHIPIICAIGHSDNYSLLDYVADLSVSIPTDAFYKIIQRLKS